MYKKKKNKIKIRVNYLLDLMNLETLSNFLGQTVLKMCNSSLTLTYYLGVGGLLCSA